MEFSDFLEVKGHKCQLSLLGIELGCTDAQSVKVCQNLSKSVNFPQMLKNLVKRKLLYSASPSSISARLQQLYNIYQNICILMFRNISNLFVLPKLEFWSIFAERVVVVSSGELSPGIWSTKHKWTVRWGVSTLKWADWNSRKSYFISLYCLVDY